MNIDIFMHYAFWVWLLMAISLIFFLLGRLVGYSEGRKDAEAIYKRPWN